MGYDSILVLDLGGHQANVMARKLRSLGFYCELQPCGISTELILRKAPKGIILAGGPANSTLNKEVFSLGLPVLSMGYAAVSMVRALGGHYAGAMIEQRAAEITFNPCPLFDGLTEGMRFFERIDEVILPAGLVPIAEKIDDSFPAFADIEKKLYGIQFYPESNDPDGAAILTNFAAHICGCADDWGTTMYINNEVAYLQNTIGDRDVILAVSGGSDSTVCAAILHHAIGSRLKCVFVDTGLLRQGEAEEISQIFREQMGIELICADYRQKLLTALDCVTDPLEKRRIVHDNILCALRDEAQLFPKAGFLAEGIRYSDTIRNGTPPEDERLAPLKMLFPLRMLFKEEILNVGRALAVPEALLTRRSFPGAGLAARCLGEVTSDRLHMLRKADAIFAEQLREAGLDKRISQTSVVLTDIQTTINGCRGYTCVLRALNFRAPSDYVSVRLPFDLIDRIVTDITTQCDGINRVVYDFTPCKTTDLEWI